MSVLHWFVVILHRKWRPCSGTIKPVNHNHITIIFIAVWWNTSNGFTTRCAFSKSRDLYQYKLWGSQSRKSNLIFVAVLKKKEKSADNVANGYWTRSVVRYSCGNHLSDPLWSYLNKTLYVSRVVEGNETYLGHELTNREHLNREYWW